MKMNNFGMATLGPDDEVDLFIDESDWDPPELEALLVENTGANIHEKATGDCVFKLRAFEPAKLLKSLREWGVEIG
jgi:hypothetical protein